MPLSSTMGDGPPELVGTSEIATMLRVTNERVQQVSERTGFPEPVVVLAGGPVWDRAEIEAWARARGNGGR